MSVIVRHPQTGKITLYTKGADSAILTRLAPPRSRNMSEMIEETQTKTNNYAKQGLRTLLMAKRTLKDSEYLSWNNQHGDAEKGADDSAKERRIRDSFGKIENNLVLLGATGIEDQLQEGVPETLSALIAAGIVVWVLTGDKPDTAINISYSAKLFEPEMDILTLITRSKDAAERSIMFYLEEIEKLMENPTKREPSASEPEQGRPRAFSIIGEGTSEFNQSALTLPTKKKRALVVDGKTLTFILDKRSNLTKPFLQLSKYCDSVLCCRATPLQKAYIVKVVKEELKMRTLAIGDGANDVSMIQTADVGIGISGQEGMQAVMAADFAISKFVYLKRFLLVHGHWSYDRLSRMILYFFYKNAVSFNPGFRIGLVGFAVCQRIISALNNKFVKTLTPLEVLL